MTFSLMVGMCSRLKGGGVVVVVVVLSVLCQDGVLGEQLPCPVSERSPRDCCPCQDSSLLCLTSCPPRHFTSTKGDPDWAECQPSPAENDSTASPNISTDSILNTSTATTPSPDNTATTDPPSKLFDCQLCHMTCQTCNGPRPNHCVICADGYELDTAAQLCVKKKDSSGSNVGAIVAGVVVSVVVVVAVLVGVGLWWYRRRRRLQMGEEGNKRSISTLMSSGPTPVEQRGGVLDVESSGRTSAEKTSQVHQPRDHTYTNMENAMHTTDSIQQGHDNLFRYTRDPTLKDSPGQGRTAKGKKKGGKGHSEDEELANLPDAPARPGQTHSTPSSPTQDVYEIVDNPVPQPSAKPKPKPQPTRTTQPQAKPTAKPTSPTPKQDVYEIVETPVPHPSPKPKPTPQPQAKPTTQPQAKPTSPTSPQDVYEIVDDSSAPQPSPKPKPTPQPQPKPKPQTQPKPKPTHQESSSGQKSYESMVFPAVSGSRTSDPQPQAAKSRVTTLLVTGPNAKNKRRTTGGGAPNPLTGGGRVAASLPLPQAAFSCPTLAKLPMELQQERQAATHHSQVKLSGAKPSFPEGRERDKDYVNVGPEKGRVADDDDDDKEEEEEEDQASDPEEDYVNAGPRKEEEGEGGRLVGRSSGVHGGSGVDNPGLELGEPQETLDQFGETQETLDQLDLASRYSNTPLPPPPPPQHGQGPAADSSPRQRGNHADVDDTPTYGNDVIDDDGDDGLDYQNCL